MGIFMDRSTLPSADPSTVWLADLIEATEVVAASAEPCDPAIVKAFRHRLERRADVRRAMALYVGGDSPGDDIHLPIWDAVSNCVAWITVDQPPAAYLDEVWPQTR
jgi:hypothetical protein